MNELVDFIQKYRCETLTDAKAKMIVDDFEEKAKAVLTELFKEESCNAFSYNVYVFKIKEISFSDGKIIFFENSLLTFYSWDEAEDADILEVKDGDNVAINNYQSVSSEIIKLLLDEFRKRNYKVLYDDDDVVLHIGVQMSEE